MCLYNRLIPNPRYTVTKKNGGRVPPVLDKRTMYVPIGCGNCMECRKKKAREWQVRLLEDIRHNTNGRFITLTFSNEAIKHYAEKFPTLDGYNLDNQIATTAVREFLERWRKKYKKSLRHWLVTEIGHEGTENIHIHGIVWTNNISAIEERWNSGKHGANGFVWKGKNTQYGIVNYVNERTVNYITKYVHKIDVDHKCYKSIVLTSPGIGRGYMNRTDYKYNKYKGENTIETYKMKSGHKMAMPIYWRNKIYTDDEREQLWIIKLNKEERWVNGVKAINDEHYLALQRDAQQLSKRLGYGDHKKDWQQEYYERARREIQLLTRIAQVKKEEDKVQTWKPIDNYWEWR